MSVIVFLQAGNRKQRDKEDVGIESLPDDGNWQTAPVAMDTAEPLNEPEGRLYYKKEEKACIQVPESSMASDSS